DEALESTELRGYVANHLPEYMVPTAYMLLETIPLTANGKVDRKALPVPDATRHAESEFVAPRTETEEQLAEIWQEVLRVEQVGIYDNFFELGGHSLMATQLLSRMRNAFEVELSLRLLFEMPTIASIAAHIETATMTNGQMKIVRRAPVINEKGQRIYPVSFAQQRLWYFNKMAPGNVAYNVPFQFRLTGALDMGLMEQTFNELVARHETLRTTFADVNGQPVQVVAPSYTLKMNVIDLRDLDEAIRGQEVERLCYEDVHTPFDLRNGPLVRVAMLQLSETEHVLLLNLHHIIFDGWSMGVLVGELTAIYGALASGQPSPLPELKLQFGDVAVWQRTYLQGKVLDEQLAYWKQKFAGEIAVLAVPTDRPRPPVRSFNGATVRIEVSPELTAKLHRLNQQEGATMYMTVLAALNAMFYRYTGQEDIIIGSPIANRNRAEIEGLIGFFVNTLPMRTDLSGNPCFRELLGRVRQTALGAYAHQDVPFAQIVESLQLEHDLSRHPLYQV
ncbi:MAG: condensation domain-containing protein, partial [Tumebacillaceae bacterium]